MKVYRIKFAPDMGTDENGVAYTKDDTFKAFMDYGIVGTGWGTYVGREMDSAKLYDSICGEYRKKDPAISDKALKSAYQNIKRMAEIKEDDLIWLIYNKEYYLFRVHGATWQDNFKRDDLKDQRDHFFLLDIGNYVEVECCKVGNEINVPGKIINQMGIGWTVMQIPNAEEMSMMKWNKYATDSKLKPYEIIKKFTMKDDFWNLITNRQAESIVCTYIQVKYDCIINTETVKHSTAVYECEIIRKSDGVRFLPQVKTGKDKVDVKKYCEDINKINPDAYAVLFFQGEEYGDYHDEHLITLSKKELEDFILQPENRKYLSTSLQEVIDLCN